MRRRAAVAAGCDAVALNANWRNYPYFASGFVIISGIGQGLFVVEPNFGGPGGDNPPTVSITSPADGATISGSVTVTVSASDDDGVDSVEFRVGGRLAADRLQPRKQPQEAEEPRRAARRA